MQVHQMQQQLITNNVAAANAAANARTIEHTNVPLYYMLCKICETPQEPHFGAYWAHHVNRKTGEYLALMTQTLSYVCRKAELAY
jgi:hypothetical protein